MSQLPLTCCGGPDQACGTESELDEPARRRPHVPLPPPGRTGPPSAPPSASSPDGRLGAPVEAAQLATLLSAIAHLGAVDRTGPGALGLYLVANRVNGLASGIYRYRPQTNALAPVEVAQSARRLASCAAEPAPLLAADAVLGFAAGAADGLGPVKSAYRAVRSAGALGLTGTVVAGFVDAIGDLLALPAGNPSCVLVALTGAQTRYHR